MDTPVEYIYTNTARFRDFLFRLIDFIHVNIGNSNYLTLNYSIFLVKYELDVYFVIKVNLKMGQSIVRCNTCQRNRNAQ